jgi:hypothetical protein
MYFSSKTDLDDTNEINQTNDASFDSYDFNFQNADNESNLVEMSFKSTESKNIQNKDVLDSVRLFFYII